MPVRRLIPTVTGPEWAPDRSLRAIATQLNDLQSLKNFTYVEGHAKEDAWKQVTKSVLTRAFSSDSDILLNFARASSAGLYNIMGMPPGRMQSNYLARIAAYETALNTAIADIEMSLPEAASGVYQAENPFDFFNDLRNIMANAVSEIFITDAYIDSSLFELYLSSVAVPRLRVLSNNINPRVSQVASLFARSRQGFELRTTAALHDRVIFVDDRCWVVGQSLKDAAVKKPTYLVEITSAAGMRSQYEPLWNAASTVIKS